MVLSMITKEESDDPYQSDSKIRCPCGSSLPTDSMIKCDDSKCHVWQHMGCVIIPEKPMEGDPPKPDQFYCELCRLSRADPFLLTVAQPLYPAKLITTNIPTDGSNPGQSLEKIFRLTRLDEGLYSKREYDVQAWCILLNDMVPFRMQWPQFTDLQVNGIQVQAVKRRGSQLLGFNGRDDGPIITAFIRDGVNEISLTGCDARIFCLGVRIVKRRSLQQILNLIPKESDGEHFEDALACVRRCIGGGPMDNADSESDVEVVADFVAVNLRCPVSGSRMKVAGRFKPCAHMGCFDLETFVEMNQHSRKWQCPICLKNYSLENIIVDPYFNLITELMWNSGEDVTEVEVKPDGSWRVKTKTESERRELGDLVLWHFPNGSLYVPIDGEVEPKLELPKQIKQDGGGNFDFSTNNGIELDSTALNIDPTYGFADRNPSAPLGDAELIILSDSEEENDTLISSGIVRNRSQTDAGGVSYPVRPPVIFYRYPDDPTLGTRGNSRLGLFNGNDDEFGEGTKCPPSKAVLISSNDILEGDKDDEKEEITVMLINHSMGESSINALELIKSNYEEDNSDISTPHNSRNQF